MERKNIPFEEEDKPDIASGLTNWLNTNSKRSGGSCWQTDPTHRQTKLAFVVILQDKLAR
jgi:hypothetical protein